jgi:predicted hotdog family 3-hydroxylacyl-ACP dehydratase
MKCFADRHAGPTPVDGNGDASAHYSSRWIVVGVSFTGSDLTQWAVQFTRFYARWHVTYRCAIRPHAQLLSTEAAQAVRRVLWRLKPHGVPALLARCRNISNANIVTKGFLLGERSLGAEKKHSFGSTPLRQIAYVRLDQTTTMAKHSFTNRNRSTLYEQASTSTTWMYTGS